MRSIDDILKTIDAADKKHGRKAAYAVIDGLSKEEKRLLDDYMKSISGKSGKEPKIKIDPKFFKI